MPAQLYSYRATCDRVIDGDTLVLSVDLGFHVTVKETFRLLGINCPELGTIAGLNARNEVIRRVAFGTMRIETVKDRTEKYGRFLVRVYPLSDAGVEYELNRYLVEHGFAVEYMP